MNPLLRDNREELEILCRRFHVQRLELFGSAATKERFRAQTSDLGFLVEFVRLRPGEHFDTYFGLLEGLETLFGRPVDLVMTRAISNPYFLQAVNRTRKLIYAA